MPPFAPRSWTLLPLLLLLLLLLAPRNAAPRAVTWNVEQELITHEEWMGTLFYARGVPYNVRDWSALAWLDTSCPPAGTDDATATAAAAPSSALEDFVASVGDSAEFYEARCRSWRRVLGDSDARGESYAVRADGSAEGSAAVAARRRLPDSSTSSIFQFLASRRFIENRVMEGMRREMIERNHSTEKTFLWDSSTYSPVWKTCAIGNQYVQSSGTLLHAAEQLEYLVQTGKLPQDFDAVAWGYRTSSRVHHLAHPSQPYDGCCFVPSLPNLRAQHFLHNTLVYFPKPQPARGRPALNPLVDWAKVAAVYRDSQIVKIDGVLSAWALEALYAFCLEATIFFELKRGYVGAYLHSGLHNDLTKQITRELRVALPDLLGKEVLKNFWSYKYDNRFSHSGIKMHADGAKVNMNMWLTPDDAVLDPEAAGITIFDFGVDTAELFELSQSASRRKELHELMIAAGVRDAVIPHKRNRMVMFNSRLIHQSGHPHKPMRFKEGYENRRISMTWLFGNLIDRNTGKPIM